MKKPLILLAVSVLFATAFALGNFVPVFTTKYKISKDSKLGKATCMICHTSLKGGKLNPYGEDIKAEMKKEGTHKLTAEVLEKVEKLDSNKNGVKNIDEIKKDQLPGAKKDN